MEGSHGGHGDDGNGVGAFPSRCPNFEVSPLYFPIVPQAHAQSSNVFPHQLLSIAIYDHDSCYKCGGNSEPVHEHHTDYIQAHRPLASPGTLKLKDVVSR